MEQKLEGIQPQKWADVKRFFSAIRKKWSFKRIALFAFTFVLYIVVQTIAVVLVDEQHKAVLFAALFSVIFLVGFVYRFLEQKLNLEWSFDKETVLCLLAAFAFEGGGRPVIVDHFQEWVATGYFHDATWARFLLLFATYIAFCVALELSDKTVVTLRARK